MGWHEVGGAVWIDMVNNEIVELGGKKIEDEEKEEEE